MAPVQYPGDCELGWGDAFLGCEFFDPVS